MMPVMRSMRSFLSHTEKSSSNPMIAILPTKDPINIAMYPPKEYPAAVTDPPNRSITNATPRLAPDDIPNIDGPASGLRKAVCSIKPDTVSDAPAMSAVTVCGRRLPITMKRSGPSGSPPLKRMSNTSAGGIFTDPTNKLSRNSAASNMDITINLIVYFIK